MRGGGISYFWSKVKSYLTWDHISGKPSAFTPASHTHDDRYYTESEMDSKLSSKANSSHTHSINDVSSLQTSLDAKLNSSDLLNKIYPKGSIYMSLQNTSPASFIGGSWSKLPEGYALWTASSGLNLTSDSTNQINAGLPNITGESVFRCLSDGNKLIDSGSGCFGVADASTSWKSLSVSSNKAPDVLTFNASKSNSIYGASITVQPPAYKVYAWKRIS